MTRERKRAFWGTCVVIGILMVIVPSLVHGTPYQINDRARPALTVVGVVVALGSLVFM